MESTNSEAAVTQELLEQHLHAFKANLNKESIRMGYNDLATFFYERGLLQVTDVDKSASVCRLC